MERAGEPSRPRAPGGRLAAYHVAHRFGLDLMAKDYPAVVKPYDLIGCFPPTSVGGEPRRNSGQSVVVPAHF